MNGKLFLALMQTILSSDRHFYLVLLMQAYDKYTFLESLYAASHFL